MSCAPSTDADTALSVGELAERTYLLGPSLSRMLASLDDRGLIARTSVPGDARRAEITITATGVELVAEIAPRSEAAYAHIEGRLGPGELEQLYVLLDQVANAVSGNTYHQAPATLRRARHRAARCTTVGRRSTTTTSPIRTRSRRRCATSIPIFYAPDLGHVVVTTMTDIDTVFMNPDIFASTNVQDPIFPLSPDAAAVLGADDFDPVAVMSNRPEPDHARIRVYTRQGFSHRRLNSLEDYMRERATILLDRMIEHGSPAEYVARWPSRCRPRSCSG